MVQHKKLGKPYKQESVVELLLMNISASAMEAEEILKQLEAIRGRELGPLGKDVFRSLTNIAKNAFYAQGANRGELTHDRKFNEHLVDLLGDERLN